MDWRRFSNPTPPRPRFAPCFDRAKLSRFERLIPRSYDVMRRRTGFRGSWPRRIECMTAAEIAEGRKTGAGHGLYLGDPKRIKINHSMSATAIFANFLHENLHHARRDLTEQQVDDLTGVVYADVTGQRLGGRSEERLAKT